MNLLFFLTPKSEVVYVKNTDSMRQVMERMEYHTYQAIPMIDQYGHYVGTITEGDILWRIRDDLPFDMKKAENVAIGDIPRKRENLPVSIQSDMEDLMSKAVNQNFVPVVDDKDIFIGIITRKDIIQYLDRQVKQAEQAV
ncbi:MAG: CBS domain-containing protein [Lachnospiraceae bacterium]|nr:CBS domain-containing protein [Lachnospiraceae bacterium]MDD7024975.1 CBS domain-containing protein [Oscillospiraceae bacterium]MDY5541226.1 CBS domain-containing protein [Lachnospiraceae bacterium]MDY5648412.1 CBS domain-containing protein [Lachnospiraceae bacterium]